jgi:hypothetical protein
MVKGEDENEDNGIWFVLKIGLQGHSVRTVGAVAFSDLSSQAPI